jgi:hypothetical protein
MATRALSQVKWLMDETDHLPQFIAVWSYTPVLSYAIMMWHLIRYGDKFTFICVGSVLDG